MKNAYASLEKHGKLKIVLLFLLIGLCISVSLLFAPVKVIHPDAVHFMSIFQEQFENTESFSDLPSSIWHAFRNCNNYDLNRGRLTNYFVFGVEALTRGHLPIPFVSWMTMFILLVNALLLGRLLSRDVQPERVRTSLFCLIVLVTVLSPILIYSYEVQFIYAKYLCITFILLLLLVRSMLLKAVFVVCLIFTDEIGIMLAAVVAFFGTAWWCASSTRAAADTAKDSARLNVTSAIVGVMVLLRRSFSIMGFCH